MKRHEAFTVLGRPFFPVGGQAHNSTSYVLEGSKVVFETDGSTKIWYYYNASGAPVAFRIGSVLYIYRKNLQGDITGIYELGCELHRKRIECAIMIKVAEAFGPPEC